MKINDKILAAFLVSVGIFSSAQAMQYVKTLPTSDKKALSEVARLSDSGDLMCAEEKQRTELQNN